MPVPSYRQLKHGLVLVGLTICAHVDALRPQILPRQDIGSSFNLTSLPAKCQNICNTVIQTVNTCGTFSCLCTSAHETNATICVNCIISVAPSDQVIQQGQTIIDQYAALCNANNVSIPTQTISGFTRLTTSASGSGVSETGSGASASGSGAASGSGTLPSVIGVSTISEISGASTIFTTVSPTPTSPSSTGGSSIASSGTSAAASPSVTSNSARISAKVGRDMLGGRESVLVGVLLAVLSFQFLI